jgi:hypothetical protein
MSSVVKGGAAYFALVFAAGFALGIARVLVLAPRLGALAAVALELPVILAASWIACGWVLRRFSVPTHAGRRLSMGGVAFLLLMAAELTLALASGRTPREYLASFATAEGALGLAGQVLFALFPILRRRSDLRKT